MLLGRRSVIGTGPIDVRDPRSLHLVEMDDPFHEQIIRTSLIVRIIHMEREHQTLMELNLGDRALLLSRHR